MDFSANATKLLLQYAVTLIPTFAVLMTLEAVIPVDRAAPRRRLKSLAIWSVYLMISVLLMAPLQDLLHLEPLLALDLQPGRHSGPVRLGLYIVGPLIAGIVADFFFYWFHRAQHRFLWRLHSVHHSIRDLNVTNAYFHWSETLFQYALITVPAALLIRIDATTAPVLAALITLRAGFQHSPVKLHFGPLRRLFCDNRYHRIHHSLEPRHFDKNFAGFTPLWDVLFGTAHFPKPDEWPATGLSDIAEPDGLKGYLLAGFAAPPRVEAQPG